MHEKLTAFLELEAAVRIFNQRVFVSNRESAAFYWRAADQSQQIQKAFCLLRFDVKSRNAV